MVHLKSSGQESKARGIKRVQSVQREFGRSSNYAAEKNCVDRKFFEKAKNSSSSVANLIRKFNNIGIKNTMNHEEISRVYARYGTIKEEEWTRLMAYELLNVIGENCSFLFNDVQACISELEWTMILGNLKFLKTNPDNIPELEWDLYLGTEVSNVDFQVDLGRIDESTWTELLAIECYPEQHFVCISDQEWNFYLETEEIGREDISEYAWHVLIAVEEFGYIAEREWNSYLEDSEFTLDNNGQISESEWSRMLRKEIHSDGDASEETSESEWTDWMSCEPEMKSDTVWTLVVEEDEVDPENPNNKISEIEWSMHLQHETTFTVGEAFDSEVDETEDRKEVGSQLGEDKLATPRQNNGDTSVNVNDTKMNRMVNQLNKGDAESSNISSGQEIEKMIISQQENSDEVQVLLCDRE